MNYNNLAIYNTLYQEARNRCHEYHNCFPFRELEETTRPSLNCMDEDYPARPEV